jgi:AcrR family transcriptional regulator
MTNSGALPDDAGTRERLLRAAAHLFARHGIDAVRLHEINTLAGQRNESAIHYYFGGRWPLVKAILEENDLAASEMVHPRRRSSMTPKAVAKMLVDRLAVGLATPEGRDWLRIVFQLMTRFPSEALPDDRPAAVAKLLEGSLRHLPPDLLWNRTIAMLQFMTLQMAERARMIDDDRNGDRDPDDDDVFVDDLTRMSVAILKASPSPKRT